MLGSLCSHINIIAKKSLVSIHRHSWISSDLQRRCSKLPLKSQFRQLHVAIVGSGPSGFYMAEELKKSGLESLKVDMYEKLPVPYGLVRSGVAPDHPEVKSVINNFHALASQDFLRFMGNVHVGKDISVEELKNQYQAVVLAYGADDDKKLGIPGEHLKGVHSARSFVEWYNALQDKSIDFSDELKSTSNVVIIGNGNVAVDVARILLAPPISFQPTDINRQSQDALEKTSISRVNIVGRRGPAQAAFTNKELRELLSLPDVRTIIGDGMLMITEADKIEMNSRAKKRQMEMLQHLFGTTHTGPGAKVIKPKTLALCFNRIPVEFEEDPKRPGYVGSVKFQQSILEGPPGQQYAVPVNHYQSIPAQLAFTSIGYRSTPLPEVPFDSKRGIIPNQNGRVSDCPGLYVCGWVKRGPTGIIGTNKFEAEEVAFHLIADYKAKREATIAGAASPETTISGKPISQDPLIEISKILRSRNVKFITFEDWMKIDTAEVVRGMQLGKVRDKILTGKEMLNHVHGEAKNL